MKILFILKEALFQKIFNHKKKKIKRKTKKFKMKENTVLMTVKFFDLKK